jgi:hypothetical protein
MASGEGPPSHCRPPPQRSDSACRQDSLYPAPWPEGRAAGSEGLPRLQRGGVPTRITTLLIGGRHSGTVVQASVLPPNAHTVRLLGGESTPSLSFAALRRAQSAGAECWGESIRRHQSFTLDGGATHVRAGMASARMEHVSCTLNEGPFDEGRPTRSSSLKRCIQTNAPTRCTIHPQARESAKRPCSSASWKSRAVSPDRGHASALGAP